MDCLHWFAKRDACRQRLSSMAPSHACLQELLREDAERAAEDTAQDAAGPSTPASRTAGQAPGTPSALQGPAASRRDSLASSTPGPGAGNRRESLASMLKAQKVQGRCCTLAHPSIWRCIAPWTAQ